MVFITLFEDLINGNAFGNELIDPVTDRYLACASYLVLRAVSLNRAYLGYLGCWLMIFPSITRYMRVSFVMKLIAVTGLNLTIYSNCYIFIISKVFSAIFSYPLINHIIRILMVIIMGF